MCGHTTARARRADGHRARAPPLDASPRASVAREGRRRFLSRARLAQSRAVAETRGKTRGKTREAVVRSFVGASTDGSSPPTTMEERAVSSAHASPSSTERTIAPERVFERCRDAARALEVAALGAVSHREKCSALWGQAEATMLALEEVENMVAMYDDAVRVIVKRNCVSVLSKLTMGRTLVEVYGSYTTAQKMARYIAGWTTDAKFEELTRELEALETQLWHMTGAAGRLGVAVASGDGRRRLLRGGFGQTLDTIFGSGILAMCAGGSDGSELWWSTGGQFARLHAYDMFIQGQREIARPRLNEDAEGVGIRCLTGSSAGAPTLNAPIVTMSSSTSNDSVLLWAGLRNGVVMAWDCDLGKLLSTDIVLASRDKAVTAIAPIDATRAWVGCEDGTIVEVHAPATKPDSSWSYSGKCFKTRDVFPADANERPSFGEPRENSKGVRCMIHNANEGSDGFMFIACERDLFLEIWDIADATCVRVEALDDLGAVVSLMQHPTVRDLIVSVHETGAVQLWGGDKCAVKTGDRVMTITPGFKQVEKWSLAPFSKYFGKTVIGAVAVENVLVIGHASGKLTIWSLPGAQELHDTTLHSETLASSPASASVTVRWGKRVAHESGLVHLTKIDGGGSLGVVTVGRFGSIMYWPLAQLESGLGKGRKPRPMLGTPSKMNEDRLKPKTPESGTLSDTARIAYEHIKLVQKIGEGSFGRVYKAKWNHIDVAVKFIGPSDIDVTASGLGRSLEELEKEVSIMTKLRHPNIVLLLGVVMSPRPAIVQEFCVRGSLYTVLQRHAKSGAPELTWRLRLQMALGAAAGMLYLHECTPTVLHRDLKSANLMVDRYYRVKVGDFNLSRAEIVASSESAEFSGNLHSPSWMAPEVLCDSQYSKASDVYSFAVVMWEIQSLQTPWKDLHIYQIVTAVPDGERLDPTATHGVVFHEAKAYQDLMMRAWQQDPAVRPCFEQLVEEVTTLLSAEIARDPQLKKGEKSAPARAQPPPLLQTQKSSSFSVRDSIKRRSVRESIKFSSVIERRSSSVEALPSAVRSQSRKSQFNDEDLEESVIIETPYATPAASPEKATGKEPEAKPIVIDAGEVPSASLLIGMRARNSFNSSTRESA